MKSMSPKEAVQGLKIGTYVSVYFERSVLFVSTNITELHTLLKEAVATGGLSTGRSYALFMNNNEREHSLIKSYIEGGDWDFIIIHEDGKETYETAIQNSSKKSGVRIA